MIPLTCFMVRRLATGGMVSRVSSVTRRYGHISGWANPNPRPVVVQEGEEQKAICDQLEVQRLSTNSHCAFISRRVRIFPCREKAGHFVPGQRFPTKRVKGRWIHI